MVRTFGRRHETFPATSVNPWGDLPPQGETGLPQIRQEMPGSREVFPPARVAQLGYDAVGFSGVVEGAHVFGQRAQGVLNSTLEGANRSLGYADRALNAAEGVVDSRAFATLGYIPGVKGYAESAANMVDTARTIVDTGQQVVGAADELRYNPDARREVAQAGANAALRRVEELAGVERGPDGRRKKVALGVGKLLVRLFTSRGRSGVDILTEATKAGAKGAGAAALELGRAQSVRGGAGGFESTTLPTQFDALPQTPQPGSSWGELPPIR